MYAKNRVFIFCSLLDIREHAEWSPSRFLAHPIARTTTAVADPGCAKGGGGNGERAEREPKRIRGAPNGGPGALAGA